MLYEIGRILGWLLVVLFIFAFSTLVVKRINKVLNKHNLSKALKKEFPKIMKFIIKNHKYFGIYMLIFVFLHMGIMTYYFGISISGIVLLSTLFITLIIGLNIRRIKNKKRYLDIHRYLAFFMFISIIIHIVFRI